MLVWAAAQLRLERVNTLEFTQFKEQMDKLSEVLAYCMLFFGVAS